MKTIDINNSLGVKYPELAKEWHPTKNGFLTPYNVSYSSHKMIHWKDIFGHEWIATVNSRSSQETGCPYCSGKRVNKDNCLATLCSQLSLEWDCEKNKDLTPEMVTCGSGKKVWWKCLVCGQSWESTIINRVNGNGCPYCANRKPCIKNCLAIVNPKLAEEWHPTRNGKLSPYDVVCGGKKLYWWKCKNGHEWMATIDGRRSGNGCPYCSNQKVCRENCLAILNPKLAREWHPTKNGKLTPWDVVCGGKKLYWWKCKNGHEWQATIYDRNRGTGCMCCYGKKVTKETGLAVTNPKLAKEWHPTKNGKLTPYDVMRGSHIKVWWIDKYGHEWMASVNSRDRGNGCPHCNGIILKNGEHCDSIPEAYMYLKYKKDGLNFLHNKPYGGKLGRCRYDFYFPEDNRYVEITSYPRTVKNKTSYLNKILKGYYETIARKRRYVTRVLKSKFELVEFLPTKKQIQFVKQNRK